MSYHIYQSDVFIYRAAARGEDSMRIWMLGREMGRVNAHVQAAARSRKQGNIAAGTLCQVDCIVGKGGWRVTGVTGARCLPLQEMPRLYTRIVQVVHACFPPEIATPWIYDLAVSSLQSAAGYPRNSPHQQSIELLFLAHMLHGLGYLSLPLWLQQHDYTRGIERVFIESNSSLLRHLAPDINAGLTEALA